MLIPIIMSGGTGSRLWPVSRESYPKPFIKMSDGESLLTKTYSRAIECDEVGGLVTVTNRDYYFQSKDCWPSDADSAMQPMFLLEPEARNTAAAVLIAALHVEEIFGPDAIMLVLPADHLVLDVQNFTNDVAQATKLAKLGHLVTFGITPAAPDSGFGYLRVGEKAEGDAAWNVSSFLEKPSISKAAELLSIGGHYWNSGIFCFSAKAILAAFSDYAPSILASGKLCWNSTKKTAEVGRYTELDTESFKQIENISFDHCIMEHSDNVVMVKASFDWSDVGSWDSLAKTCPADSNGNQVIGQVFHEDSRNCFVQSEGRLVATIGLEDVMIIDTPDALLVTMRNRCQDVKQVVAALKSSGHPAYKTHRTVARPWGSYTVLEEAEGFKIKRIEVKPGASLSLQMHHHRSEHWIVVSGTAEVVNGDKTFLVLSNESTYIPAGHRHRLHNPGILNLVMIEVQSGNYLEEDDIVRFEDHYGRT